MIEFDRKQQDTYLLHIQARDRGSPALSSETNITFTIIPRNEYAPKCLIENNRTALSIRENSPEGIVLTTISCYDKDQNGLNGQMSVLFTMVARRRFSKYNEIEYSICYYYTEK